MAQPKTYSEVLRTWTTAAALRADLARHGCEVTEVLIRQWWNGEMLPSHAWLPLTLAADEAGRKDITLEALATIARTDRKTRLELLREQERAA